MKNSTPTPPTAAEKRFAEKAQQARTLAKPGHWWWMVFHNGKHIGNVPGYHQEGALKRAFKLHFNGIDMNANTGRSKRDPLVWVTKLEFLGRWNPDTQRCESDYAEST